MAVVEIPRGHQQLDYFAPAGQWVPRGAVLRCLIDDSTEGEPVIHIDDHELSLREFGGLLRTYAGWGMALNVDDPRSVPSTRCPSLVSGLVPLFPSRPRVESPLSR
jgi:hypothetical protein